MIAQLHVAYAVADVLLGECVVRQIEVPGKGRERRLGGVGTLLGTPIDE